MSMLFTMAGGTIVTETFFVDTTWVAPPSTTKIIKVEGKGGDGVAPAYNLTHTFNIYSVIYRSTGSGPSPMRNWAYMQAVIDTAKSFIDNPIYASVSGLTLDAYPTSSETITTPSISLYANRQAGATITSYIGTAWSSGSITGNGSANLSYKYLDSGSFGTASTAFGQTFSGGTPSVPSAPLTTFTNITVTPGASYNIVVRGAFVKITYAK